MFSAVREGFVKRMASEQRLEGSRRQMMEKSRKRVFQTEKIVRQQCV